MAVTLTSTGAVILKAGKNVSSDLISGSTSGGLTSEAAVNQLINQAESYINSVTRKDWVAAYSDLPTDKRKVLDKAVSDEAAMYCINYDPNGYGGLRVAEFLMDVLRDKVKQATDILKEKEKETFITK